MIVVYTCNMKKLIKRRAEIAYINNLLSSSPVTAILGPRQCGKTVLANQVEFDHYFDLENPRDLARLERPQLALEELKGLIVIDEIQRLPNIFQLIRYLVDSNSQQKYLILGSASKELIRQSSESLAGRIAYHRLGGFTLSDIGKNNLQKLTAAYNMAAHIDEIMPVEDPQSQVFNLAVKSWRQLDLRQNIQSISAAFRLKLLELSGFFPQMETCICCGNRLGPVGKSNKIYYQRNKHRFHCGRSGCVSSEGNLIEISAGSLKMIRVLKSSPIESAHTFKVSKAQAVEIENLLRRMFEYALERRPRAFDVVDQLAI